jgi:hypothetical protein
VLKTSDFAVPLPSATLTTPSGLSSSSYEACTSLENLPTPGPMFGMSPVFPDKVVSFGQLQILDEKAWRQGELQADDTRAMMSTVDFLMVIHSFDKALRIGREMLSRTRRAPHDVYLPWVALSVMKSSRYLSKGLEISNLMRTVIYWTPDEETVHSADWCLLRSTLGICLLHSNAAQQPITICRNAMESFESSLSSSVLSWQYLALILNLHKACAVGQNLEYDAIDIWRRHLNRLDPLIIADIVGALENVLFWCHQMLEDASLWRVFEDSAEGPWTLGSEVSATDVSEFEAKVLFLFFWHCFQPECTTFKALTYRTQLLSALDILRRRCSAPAMIVFSAISTMIMRADARQGGPKYKSNLPRRALSHIANLPNLEDPMTTISRATGWEGPPLVANFVETCALKELNSRRCSSEMYRQTVNSFMLDFANIHYKISLSPYAFENTLPRDQSTTTAVATTPAHEGCEEEEVCECSLRGFGPVQGPSLTRSPSCADNLGNVTYCRHRRHVFTLPPKALPLSELLWMM